jgi:hypothetical protein
VKEQLTHDGAEDLVNLVVWFEAPSQVSEERLYIGRV